MQKRCATPFHGLEISKNCQHLLIPPYIHEKGQLVTRAPSDSAIWMRAGEMKNAVFCSRVYYYNTFRKVSEFSCERALGPFCGHAIVDHPGV
jgi:hypothetical protein